MDERVVRKAARLLDVTEDYIRRPEFLEGKMPSQWDYYVKLYECDEKGRDGWGWVYMTGREFLKWVASTVGVRASNLLT